MPNFQKLQDISGDIFDFKVEVEEEISCLNKEIDRLNDKLGLIVEIKTPTGKINYSANSLQDQLIMEELKACYENLNPVLLLQHLQLIQNASFLL